MRVADFDYTFDETLVASEPPATRDGGRLLRIGPDSFDDALVASLPEHLPEGSLVVLNDTRVMPARLLGERVGSGGKVELLLIERQPDDSWKAMGRASKPLREGSRLRFGSLEAEVLGRDDALYRVRLLPGDEPLATALQREGHMPLPPYMRRPDTAADRERYQTVFAAKDGAVAAPTAGLHLTPALLERLAARHIEVATVTLHVSLGTFQPVVVDDLDAHPMHAEHYEITTDTAAAVARARDRGARVVAIGTTVVRALESARDPQRPGQVRAERSSTRLLIQPGYRFSVVDTLFTNFHLPKSTLLALVCAFGGTETVLGAYEHAVRQRYRLFSYGDAMLLDRRTL